MYCVDRTLTISLGRPLSIPDEWIRVEVGTHDFHPDFNCRHSRLTSKFKLPDVHADQDIAPSIAHTVHPSPIKCLQMIHIKHRLLISEIYTNLWTPPTAATPPVVDSGWIASMLDRIEQWNALVAQGGGRYSSLEWYQVQYHYGLVMLCRPTPRNRTPSPELLMRAVESSGEVMRLFKIMHREEKIHFSKYCPIITAPAASANRSQIGLQCIHCFSTVSHIWIVYSRRISVVCASSRRTPMQYWISRCV